MYLEIDNQSPIPVDAESAVTILQFPDGMDLQEAVLTAREAIQYHVADGKIAGFRSDNQDLVEALEQFYGLKPAPVPKASTQGNGVAQTTLALALGILFVARTRLQLRYNNGASWQAGVMGNPSSTGTGAYAPGIYMGISSDATAPTNTDTTLVGEIISGTLSRGLATYAYTTAATTYTESKVYTSDQTVTIYKCALFTVATAGSPIFGSLLTAGGVNSPKSLFSGDQVGITETVNF
jgi:hypothetical protein